MPGPMPEPQGNGQPDKSPTELALEAKVAELERMIRTVGDAGRIMNFDNAKDKGKKPMRVKVSQYNGGLIIGWRTVKDELIKHPMTGRTAGEEQQYEVLIQMPNGEINKTLINGYLTFSEARYNDRIDGEVIGRKEDWSGNLTFEIMLGDGRKLELDSRFVN